MKAERKAKQIEDYFAFPRRILISPRSCKGTIKRGEYETKKHFFVSISERKYFRPKVKISESRAESKKNADFFALPSTELRNTQ